MSAAAGTMHAVIASKKQAKRYGKGRASGLLLVDGTDETVFRKAEIALKPSTRKQRRSLNELVSAVCEVYNGALQERRDAYRHSSKTSVTRFAQFNQIKDLKGVRDDLLAWGVQPLRWAMARVDEAFTGFFDRVSFGDTPGFPRFKGWRRFDTVGSCGHYEHADINAARNIRARGIAAELAWQMAGRPLLKRQKPRLRRRKDDDAAGLLAA